MHLEDEEAQFIFIRNKEQDLIAVQNMLEDDIWPIEMIGDKFY